MFEVIHKFVIKSKLYSLLGALDMNYHSSICLFMYHRWPLNRIQNINFGNNTIFEASTILASVVSLESACLYLATQTSTKWLSGSILSWWFFVPLGMLFFYENTQRWMVHWYKGLQVYCSWDFERFFVLSYSSSLLACYLLPNPALFSCCSPIAPTFSVRHFLSVKLYCGIIHPCRIL